MTDRPCGCCEGTEPITPQPLGNRPGLSALRYRIGTHGTFLETMLARLGSHQLDDGRRPLQALTTRAPSDPAIAFLDAWATVADVLTFYQERLANEGFLRTATERRSVLELARLVGYRLRPGVAASVYLAFSLEKDYRIDVPAGTRAQSVPGPGELPQFYESDEALPARTEWNAIPARITRPVFLRPDRNFKGTRQIWVEGAVTGLRPGDALLLMCGKIPLPYRVQAVAADAAANETRVTYVPFAGFQPEDEDDDPSLSGTATGTPMMVQGGSAPEGSSLATQTPGIVNNTTSPGGGNGQQTSIERLDKMVDALRIDPSQPPPSRFQLKRTPARAWSAAADLAPRLLTEFTPRLKDTLYTALAASPAECVQPADRAFAFRVKAGLYGSTAPQELIFNRENVPQGRREWPQVEFGTMGRVFFTPSNPQFTAAGAFQGRFDLRNNVNPLQFTVNLDDGTGGTRFQHAYTLRALVSVTSAAFGQPNPKFTDTRQVPGGGEVVVTASYTGQPGGAGYDGAVLEYVEVRFRLWPGHETRIRAVAPGEPVIGLVESPPDVLSVEIDDDPLRQPVLNQPTVDTVGSRVVAIALTSAMLAVAHRTPRLATPEQLRTLSLDATHDGIAAGSMALIARPGAAPVLALVLDTRTVSRGDYGVSGRVTQLVFKDPWLGDPATSPALDPTQTLALLRNVTVYAQSEALHLAPERIVADVGGAVIELDGLYDGLEAGRWLMVKGVRTDVPGVDPENGVEATELAMLAGVEHAMITVTTSSGKAFDLPGDTLHTRVTLSAPLAYTYRRDSFTLNANVVRATHGETRRETLGSGDGRIAFQQFTLKSKPLTYLAAPTPSGVESTLEVRVNQVRWPERETLLYLGATDRGYSTQADDAGNVTLVFGDGVRGTRLPTGVENVTAVYRAGIGRGGNVGAGAINTLATRPLGVKEVINPQPANGGADPETRDQARRNVPIAVLALDRLVSVRDYADFARVYAGIGKASAALLSDGRRQVVHLTVAGADDIAIDPAGDLYRNLMGALARHGDANQPLQVAAREAVFLFISAKVKVMADYLWDDVEPRVRAALLESLGFDRRELGEAVLLSQVIATIQAVEGVDYVDVDLLDGVSESDAAVPSVLMARLTELAAAVGAGGAADACCASCHQPRQRVSVQLARVDAARTKPSERLRPAQIAYLNPALPDTLVLTEVSS